MKILYKQSATSSTITVNRGITFRNTYLKELTYKNDFAKTTLKPHCHNEYEVHMVFFGKQCYEIDGITYEIQENEFMLIPPKVKHRMISASEKLLKYSITFDSSDFSFDLCYHGLLPEACINSINFIAEEANKKMPFSAYLIESRVWEVLILLSRAIGQKENGSNTQSQVSNSLADLAKEFILDNIEQSISAEDVAFYCHLSTRQLYRIFQDAEGVSPTKYIHAEKMKRIGNHLKNTDLTLREISELFSYRNEYYFNTSFKKHYGMPPSAYRKMFR